MQKSTHKKSIQKAVVKHLIVFAGAVFISMVFSLVNMKRLIHDGTPVMLLLTFLQLELFLWLGARFFRGIKPESKGVIRKSVVRLLLFYATVLLIAFTLFLSLYAFFYMRAGGAITELFPNLLNAELKNFIVATVVGFGIGTLFFFFTQWADAVKHMQKLKEEKLIFQYETLKSQVNPHFLFNSLNTLSSLVATDPDQSETFIQTLSSVYRYVLENRERELVSVEEELQFVKDFFALQKIRDGEKISLKIESNGDGNAFIMPVSIQMLVENALKHNVASRKDPLFITIHYEGIDKLVVRNNLQMKSLYGKSSKIGLKNLNERCKLILDREIEIMETADEFVVKVPLKLK